MTDRIGLDTNLLIAQFGEPETWCGISASGVGPTIECPTRLALPAAFTKSDAADRGNELHAFARIVTVNPSGRAQALLDMPEKWRHTAEGMDLVGALDGLRVVGCERAYALDVKERKVRYIGEDIGRNYQREQPLGRYEVPFTMDVEAFYGDTPVELDYKSGQSIGDPMEHWQRRVCAVGLMIFHDTPTAISRVAYIWDDGRIMPDGCEFSVLDVDDFCDTIVKAIDRVWEARLLLANGIMPSVSPSDDACKYCPAMMSCPYYTNTAKAMLGKLQDIEKGPELSALSLEELGKVWEMAKTIEKLVEPLIDGIKLMAAKQPIPVGEKYEVRPAPRSRTYFDDSKARGMIVRLLAESGATEEEIQSKLKSLSGKTDYVEFRKVKRHLTLVA